MNVTSRHRFRNMKGTQSKQLLNQSNMNLCILYYFKSSWLKRDKMYVFPNLNFRSIFSNLQVLNSIFTTINSTSSSHALILLSTSHLGQVLLDYILLIRGTKYMSIPSWLNTWAFELHTKLHPLLFVSLTLHGWLAIFLPNSSEASLPPGEKT